MANVLKSLGVGLVHLLLDFRLYVHRELRVLPFVLLKPFSIGLPHLVTLSFMQAAAVVHISGVALSRLCQIIDIL